ncbi:MAG: hypothetical protein GEV12_21905 [Micromonosporaceae bacterium]|nr:hypothetical protein [Micromonosporaceae bacterium]
MRTMSRRFHADQGSISAFVVILAATLVLVAGLVLDGGRIISARREVSDVAQNAARAGAQAISLAEARAGTTTVDPGAATAAVAAYLARTGHRGSPRVTGDTVEVTVVDTVPMLLLSIASVGDRTVHAVETARIVQGVTGAES